MDCTGPVWTVTLAEDLRENLKQSFEVEFCRKLFDSIRRRCELCIKNKGVHIPY